MPLDAEFHRIAEPLRVALMGTEHLSGLLYSLVTMLRPRSLLEIGAGYSTLFLARAAADAAFEAQEDRRSRQSGSADDHGRASILLSDTEEYQPHLYVIDNLRDSRGSAGFVLDALDRLGVSDRTTFVRGEFAGASLRLPQAAIPFDFVWFDCSAADRAGVDFINEYWPLVNGNGGLVALHSMHIPLGGVLTTRGKVRIPSPLLNELRKQQADAGRKRSFELLTLTEPHKLLQGDVAFIQKTGLLSRIRDASFEEDAKVVLGRDLGSLISL